MFFKKYKGAAALQKMESLSSSEGTILKLRRPHHASRAMRLLQCPFIINSAALGMTGQHRLGVIHNGENYLF